MSLVTEIINDKSLEAQIEALELIPSKGGVFKVMLNNELIFSKKSLWRHAEAGEVYKLIKDKVT